MKIISFGLFVEQKEEEGQINVLEPIQTNAKAIVDVVAQNEERHRMEIPLLIKQNVGVFDCSCAVLCLVEISLQEGCNCIMLLRISLMIFE